jgi:1-acyl-sn-glycerol-3-phosphate acyltransferase
MAKVLRLYQMILQSKGNVRRRMVHAVVSIALRLFFRRIETSGAMRVPMHEPLIFVLNNPNGLIDPGLVFVALPRRVSFLAKSTLFKLPVISFVLKTLEALPLYRRIDATAENPAVNVTALNQRTFAASYELLQRNRCIALFPEGVSHNSTYLLPVKTGVARIALGALSVNKNENSLISLKIVPVGLYYTSKTSFRSEALLRFGEPFEVFPVELDAEGQPPREAVHELSEKIGEKLREVTLNVDSTDALETVERTEKLFSSVYESINFRFSLSDELDLRQSFAERIEKYQTENPEGATILTERIAIYEKRLRELGVSPEHLSVSNHSTGYVFRHFVLRLALIFVFLPLVVVGALIHFPAYLLCLLAGQIFKRHGPDESGGTIKILTAMFLMPLTWLIITAVVFFTSWFDFDFRNFRRFLCRPDRWLGWISRY